MMLNPVLAEAEVVSASQRHASSLAMHAHGLFREYMAACSFQIRGWTPEQYLTVAQPH